MRPTRTWHRAILLIAVSLVAASAMALAARGKQDDPAKSFSFLINPSHGTWLGLIVKDTDEATTKKLKLPHVTGAEVVSVIPDSPAAKAGFQKNDVLLKFDGERVRSAAQLQRLVKETPPGRTVKVEISRAGKLQTLEAKIEDRGPNAFLEQPANPKYRFWTGPEFVMPQEPEPGPLPEAPRKIMPLPPVIPKFYLGPLPNLNPQLPQLEPFIQPNPEVPESPHLWVFPKPGPKGEVRPFLRLRPARENSLGISGQDLTPQLARFFGVKEGRGILVSQVDKGSPASAAGLKAGDVIVRLGSHEVGSMAELQGLLQTQPNRKRRVILGVVRNREERQMSVLLKPDRLTPHQRGVRPEPIMAGRSR